jgi:hypothetical protein
MKYRFSIIAILIILASCSKDRDLPILKEPNKPGDTTGVDVTYGIIRINELVAKGSTLINEFGIASDWLELYNNSNQNINLQGGLWSITDVLSDPDKFILPPVSIPAGGHLVIFCNDSTSGIQQIHTGFGLSSNGENVGLFYFKDGNYIAVDTLSFGLQTTDNMSVARIPDGSDNIQYPSNPSPGAINQ